MRNLSRHLDSLSKATAITKLQLWGLIVIFAVFPLGQLERIALTSSITLYFHDIAIFLWLISVLKEKIIKGLPVIFRENYREKKLFFLYGAWVALGVGVALLKSGDYVPLAFIGRVLLYGAFAFFVWQKLRETHFIKQMLLITGMWYWWLALMQYIFVPDIRFLWAYGWDDHYFRMIGTLLDPSFTGSIFLLTLLTACSLRKTIPTWIFYTTSLALTAGIVLTYSRASYLTYISITPFVLFLEFSKKITARKVFIGLLGVFLLFCLYLFAPKPGGEGVNLLRTTTIYARIMTTTQALGQLSGYEWVLGQGLFSANELQKIRIDPVPTHARMPDNIFITLLSQTGIVGLVFALLILRKWLYFSWKNNRYVTLATLAVLIQSQFTNTLLQPFVLLYFLLFIGSKNTKI